MTYFDHEPVQRRKERLLRRATDLHEQADRLALELNGAEEGEHMAKHAAETLRVLLGILAHKGDASAGQ